MKRFFFALMGGPRPSPDEIGSEFDSLEAAFMEGCRAALEISLDMLKARLDPNALRFEITDADGRFLTEIFFSEMLRPAGRPQRPQPVSEPLRRFRSQAADRRRIAAELAGELALTSSTLAATRDILARSRRQSAEPSGAGALRSRPSH